MDAVDYQHVRLLKYAAVRAEPGKQPVKARVWYCLNKDPSGKERVSIYAKDYSDGSRLQQVIPDCYRNDTDSATDYFEKGSCELSSDHPLFEKAKAMVAEVAESRERRKTKKLAKQGLSDNPAPAPKPKQEAPASQRESAGILAW